MVVDLVVVGGGVVGWTAAIAFRRRHPTARVVVVEKEVGPGLHASGRNSGVLHAGFYYAADSLKARLCRDGNASWKAWCLERRIPLRETGKLVVPTTDAEVAGVERLVGRAAQNGVEVVRVSVEQMREIEPTVAPRGPGLWSPTTAVVSARAVMDRLAEEGRGLGVEARYGAPVTGGRGAVEAGGERIVAGRILNAAGLGADRVARALGLDTACRVVPFRGFYAKGPDVALRTQVYPVPDPALPFLGVHLTLGVDGVVKIGPTAVPGLWREQYGGLAGFSVSDAIEVARNQATLLARDPRARAGAARELAVLTRRGLVAAARRLVPSLPTSGWRWAPVGVRAQLLGPDGHLVDDFVVETSRNQVHVLNAVSPAFTSAWPLAELLCDRLEAVPSG
jgi:L-2-hydroxyglutarate oxidase